MVLELLSDPDVWIAFATLAALEIVLGIDNVVFISILADKLPVAQRTRARTVGLGLAALMRVGLLFSIAWIVGLTAPLFEVLGREVSGRDLVLLFGGLFLIAKSVHEIHGSLEGPKGHGAARVAAASFGAVIAQILLLDIVFSLDSVLTAVGLVDEVAVMVAAILLAVAVMLWFSGPVSAFVSRHPTVKMLALSFLILIGMVLVAEGIGHHVPKGYVYFSMAFALGVEMLNLRVRRTTTPPVELHNPYASTKGER